MLGIFLAITAGLGWGTAAVFARLGLQGIKPSTGTLVSLASSVTLVGSVALIVNFDTFASLTPKAILWFGLIGLVTYVIGRQSNFADDTSETASNGNHVSFYTDAAANDDADTAKNDAAARHNNARGRPTALA